MPAWFRVNTIFEVSAVVNGCRLLLNACSLGKQWNLSLFVITLSASLCLIRSALSHTLHPAFGAHTHTHASTRICTQHTHVHTRAHERLCTHTYAYTHTQMLTLHSLSIATILATPRHMAPTAVAWGYHAICHSFAIISRAIGTFSVSAIDI